MKKDIEKNLKKELLVVLFMTSIVLTAFGQIIPPYRITTTSELPPSHGQNYGAANLTDNSWNSWSENKEDSGIGETITIGFMFQLVTLEAIYIQNGFGNPELFYDNNRVKRVLVKPDTMAPFFLDLRDDMALVRYTFPTPVSCTKLEIEILDVYKGEKWDDTCLAEISFRPMNAEYSYHSSILQTVAKLCSGRVQEGNVMYFPEVLDESDRHEERLELKNYFFHLEAAGTGGGGISHSFRLFATKEKNLYSATISEDFDGVSFIQQLESEKPVLPEFGFKDFLNPNLDDISAKYTIDAIEALLREYPERYRIMFSVSEEDTRLKAYFNSISTFMHPLPPEIEKNIVPLYLEWNGTSFQ